jgi:hypothetical protein
MTVTATHLEAPRRRPPPVGLIARGSGHRAAIGVAAWSAGLAVALFAPFLVGGTLLLLDYADMPVGPHATLGANVWGFPPGLSSRAPVTATLLVLFRALPFGFVEALPLVMVVLVAAYGMYRLLGRRALPAIAATTLFVVDPFTYDRASAGQVFFLLGYALLPLVLWLATLPPATRRGVWLGLLFALQAAFSVHFVFITGALFVAVLALGPGDLRARLRMMLVTAVVALLACAYWLIPIASQSGELARVTFHDVDVFRTQADPTFGLALNLLGLHGFWRGTWTLKEALPAWPLFTLAMLAVATVGLRASTRDVARRRVAIAVAVVGFVLACGSVGPTGGVFTWAFEHVPGFRIMREPQKFLALYVLALAWGFGLGVERLTQEVRRIGSRRAVAAVLVAVPLAASFPMLWGFWGSVRPSTYPTSWVTADRMMGPGPERILALPGDAYLSYPWTQDRAVANPMVPFFEREVLTEGDLELAGLGSQTADATSRYLGFVTSVGSRTSHFGNLMSPLGVRYVVLSKTEDWARYSWLFRQADLRVVRSWDDLVLFESSAPASLAYQPASTIAVDTWGDVVGLADTTPLTAHAIVVREARGGAIRTPVVPPTVDAALPVRAWFDDPVHVSVAGTESSRPLVVARTYDPRWTASSGLVRANLGIELLVPEPGDGATDLSFGGWRSVRAGYVVTVLALLTLLVASSIRAYVSSADRCSWTASQRSPT